MRADRKSLSIFLLVSLLQFGNDSFLLVRRHLAKMLLEEIFLLLSGAGNEGHRNPCQGSKGKVTKQISPGVSLSLHVGYPSADWVRARVSTV